VLPQRGSTPDIPHALALALFQLAVFFGPLAYAGFGWLRGGTVGSNALHLRVVDARTGGPITVEQALLRVAGVVLGAVCLGVGLFWALFDRQRRAWQDLMAGTLVVREPPVPPWVAAPAWTETTVPVAMERTAWTWTDVVPVLIVFFPLARLAATSVARAARAVNGSPLGGAGLSIEVLVADIAAYAVNIVLILALVVVRRHQRSNAVGWRRAPVRWLVAAPFFAMATIALSGIAGQLSDAIFPGTPNNQCADIRGAFGGLPALAVVATVLVAPVAEETVFRGFVHAWLLGRVPAWAAALVSATLFSAAHYAYGQPTIFLPIFCVGLVLAVMYTYTRSIWPGVIVHAGLNLLSTIVLLTSSNC
jgi:membrane protease YdiL (CAAX protease family)